MHSQRIIAFVLVTICGCVDMGCQTPSGDSAQRILTNPHAASSLINGTIKIGMEKAKVIETLGTPHKTETYGDTEFLFYNTPWYMAPSAITSNPIAIKDGKVSGLGQSYYASFHP
jgi:hypothetical protein